MVGAQRDYRRVTPIPNSSSGEADITAPIQAPKNTRLHDERKTESNRRACNRPRHRGVVGRVRVGANVRTIGRQRRRPYFIVAKGKHIDSRSDR